MLVSLRIYLELDIFNEQILIKLASRYPKVSVDGQFEILNYLHSMSARGEPFWIYF